MAFLGHRRGDISSPVINGEDQVSLQWHRLLFSSVAMPVVKHVPDAASILAPAVAVHLGPATVPDAAPAPTNHAEPILSAPIDSDSRVPGDQDPGGLGAAPISTGGAPVPHDGEAASLPADLATPAPPPPVVPAPLTESSSPPASVPDDAAPPAGHLPKSEAIIWSGPAIMAFPGEPHETGGGAAAPDNNGDTASADMAGTPDVRDAPDLADIPDVLTRADLDPVLAAMGSGADHAAASDGGGDLSAAFLPPDSGDLALPGHGLDPGFAFTPQPPLPPPPDFI
jgi:hypothetical protein